ncbi:hypothetical protein RHGRI_017026 [Rhododendron griersonianum]|uniref:Uncharacterized protein n=1 Tax=Rhododendron griersonianum TaxID=479676 RepID=A0AAV6JW94_9ERIC|nr:hypothetical protein RHGRI_017026 [Rhododendron griersonianum]
MKMAGNNRSSDDEDELDAEEDEREPDGESVTPSTTKMRKTSRVIGRMTVQSEYRFEDNARILVLRKFVLKTIARNQFGTSISDSATKHKDLVWLKSINSRILLRVALLAACVRRDLKVLSAMGAGARADVTKIRVADLRVSTNDPLSREVILLVCIICFLRSSSSVCFITVFFLKSASRIFFCALGERR